MRQGHMRTLLTCALGMAALLCACAGVETKPAPATDPAALDEAALMARATAYWKLRIDRNLFELYEYEDPKFREKHGLQAYVTAYAGATQTEASVIGPVFIEGDMGDVVVRITAFFPAMGSLTKPRKDYWQRVDGQWYHLRHPPRLRR